VWIKRSALFFCIMLGGMMLDAYWSWYSFHFAAECSESGNSVPPTWFLFTTVSLIPAVVSLTFRSNPVYVFTCFAIWLLYLIVQVYLILGAMAFEETTGINCYRDVGAGGAVTLGFAIVFSVAILAVTAAFGVAWLLRKWRHRPAP
jgi:hypothetical protein